MLLTNKEAEARLASPMNLINKLKSRSESKNSAMSLFGIGQEKTSFSEREVKKLSNPFENAVKQESSMPLAPIHSNSQETSADKSETLDSILKNNESQIKLGLVHDSALGVLTDSIAILATKLDDVKADKLPSVITAASKVVESIRRERSEASKNSKDREVHYHFYTPEQRRVSDYEVIDVGVPLGV